MQETSLLPSPLRVRLRDKIEENSSAALTENDFRMIERPRTQSTENMVGEIGKISKVGERIKFYDGCTEHTSSCGQPSNNLFDSSPSHNSPFSKATVASNTNSRPSLSRSIAPTTPTNQKHPYIRCSTIWPPSGHSTAGRSTLKTPSRKSGIPTTTSKAGPTYNTRKLPPLEWNVPNPLLHINPPTRHVSPKTAVTTQKPVKSDLIGHSVYEVSKVLELNNKNASPQRRRDLDLLGKTPTKRTKLPSHNWRTNEKLGIFSQPKSLGRAKDEMAVQSKSEDEEMRMLREKGVVANTFMSGPWSLSKVSGTRIPRPRCRDTSKTAQPATYLEELSSATMNIDTSSRTAKRPLRAEGTRIPSLIRQAQPVVPTLVKPPCSIHDKIERWEGKAEVREGFLKKHMQSCSPKSTDNSTILRRSIYENPWNNEVGNDPRKRGWDGQEARAVVNVFQDTSGQVGHGKGKWKKVVAPTLRRGGTTVQNNRKLDETKSEYTDMQIIIREAQCGLKEPKPLRVLEMKRMTLLCRERRIR